MQVNIRTEICGTDPSIFLLRIVEKGCKLLYLGILILDSRFIRGMINGWVITEIVL